MKPSAKQIREAFEHTAQAIGSDIIQCCIDAGEEPVLPREVCFDYLPIHGGEHGKEVYRWVLDSSTDEVETKCDNAGVPEVWR